MLHRNLKIRIRRGLLLELVWRMLSHIPCIYIYIYTNYIYIHIHRFSLFKASMHERVLAEMEILLNIIYLGNCRQGIKGFVFFFEGKFLSPSTFALDTPKLSCSYEVSDGARGFPELAFEGSSPTTTPKTLVLQRELSELSLGYYLTVGYTGVSLNEGYLLEGFYSRLRACGCLNGYYHIRSRSGCRNMLCSYVAARRLLVDGGCNWTS